MTSGDKVVDAVGRYQVAVMYHAKHGDMRKLLAEPFSKKAPPYCEGNDPIKGSLLLTFANIDDANTAELLYHNQKIGDITVWVYSFAARDEVCVCCRMSEGNKFSFIVKYVKTKEIPIWAWKGDWSLPAGLW